MGHQVNPLNAELNPICHLLASLGAHYILHVSWIRVKLCLIIRIMRARLCVLAHVGTSTLPVGLRVWYSVVSCGREQTILIYNLHSKNRKVLITWAQVGRQTRTDNPRETNSNYQWDGEYSDSERRRAVRNVQGSTDIIHTQTKWISR